MNIDTRARRAAQGIHEAVEVREMTMQTKVPKPVERFDDYKDKKERNRRRGALIAAAVVVILAAVLAVRTLGGGEASVPADEGNSSLPGTAAGVLDGTWQTVLITKEHVRTFLHDAGFADAADAVIADQGYPTLFSLTIRDGRFVTRDIDQKIVDEGVAVVDGSRLILNGKSVRVGATRAHARVEYTWSMAGDALTLTFVSDSAYDYKGFPHEAFNRTIYELSPLNPAA